MTRPNFIIVLLALACVWLIVPAAQAAADERAELRERFKQRYPALAGLKRAGKVGEIYTGLVGAVKDEYLNQRINPDDEKSQTIATLLAAENRDRTRLYALIAEETGATPAIVAQRNAQRNFDKAGPDEFLKLPDRDWMRKKDIKPRE